MANVRSTALPGRVKVNREQFEKSVEYLFPKQTNKNFLLLSTDNDANSSESTFNLAMTNEVFYQEVFWKIDAMQALIIPEGEEWGPFVLLYETIPPSVRPRLRQDSQEISKPKTTAKGM